MKLLKIIPGIILALVITTLAIDATDSLSGKGGSMLGQLIGFKTAVCPPGMIQVPAALTFSCVDEYEVAAGEDCTVMVPKNSFDTELNLNKENCRAENLGQSEPWRFINREQAAIMCARSNKRLPTALEWYQFSLGTKTENCNTTQAQVGTGEDFPLCTSAVQVKNTVGNVWEWVNDDVIAGQYQGRQLPETGYVKQVDNGGVATVTVLEKDSEITGEYFWSDLDGAFAMIRGGYYGSKSDAGVFAIHAHTLPTFAGNAVGFRCVL